MKLMSLLRGDQVGGKQHVFSNWAVMQKVSGGTRGGWQVSWLASKPPLPGLRKGSGWPRVFASNTPLPPQAAAAAAVAAAGSVYQRT